MFHGLPDIMVCESCRSSGRSNGYHCTRPDSGVASQPPPSAWSKHPFLLYLVSLLFFVFSFMDSCLTVVTFFEFTVLSTFLEFTV